MSIQLITVAELKSFIDKSDSNDDTLLTSIIQYVSKEFEVYCNRFFKKDQRSKYYDAGNRFFNLTAWPIDSTTTFTVTYDSDVQTINDDYFVWYDEGVVEFYETPTRSEPKQVYITWTGGYTETSSVLAVPDDLKFACVMQCAFVYARRRTLGLSGINSPDGRIQVLSTANLLPDVIKILNRYKHYAVQ